MKAGCVRIFFIAIIGLIVCDFSQREYLEKIQIPGNYIWFSHDYCNNIGENDYLKMLIEFETK